MTYFDLPSAWNDLGSQIKVENGGLFISSGSGTHRERRLNSFELILVREGRLRMLEEAAILQANAGEVIILRPGRIHRGLGEYPKNLAFYWLHFRIPSRLASRLKLPAKISPSRKERVAELFRWFLDDQTKGCLTETRARSLVCLILEELFVKREFLHQSEPRLTGLIDEAIASNFSRRLRLRDLASKVGLSEDYLNRVFGKIRGKTIAQSLRERRIQEARWLLLESNLQLKEISVRCGFSNAPHFTRSFREATGMLPREFRGLYSEIHINTH